MSMINGFFKLLRTSSLLNDPFRVSEVSVGDFDCYDPIIRDDCLVLYKTGTKETDSLKLEIVLQVDINRSLTKLYSLYRSADDIDAQVVYSQMRDKLPALLESFPELRSGSSLQAISMMIREHPSWSAAHLAAHFGYLKTGLEEALRGKEVIK